MVMRLLIIVLSLMLGAIPAFAQQWDQVNGSMQVKSGPSSPLVIIDQTNTAANSKIFSLRAAGTEKCSIDIDGDLVCTGSLTLTGPYLGATDNCATAPSYSFTGRTTTGLCSSAAGTWDLVAGGTATLKSTATAVTAAVPITVNAGAANTALFVGSATAENNIFVGQAIAGDQSLVLGWFQPSNYAYLGVTGATRPTSMLTVSNTGGVGIGAAPPATGLLLGADVSLNREGAAILQLGLNAAGVTNQMLKGPDRITSDGVGGNLTIAGGRNRGASAGGSIIFQTSPAAGVGVAGTLATNWSVDSAAGHFLAGTDNLYDFGANGASRARDIWAARDTATGQFFNIAGATGALRNSTNGAKLRLPADGQATFLDNASTSGIGLDFATDGTLKIRTRAQTADGNISAAKLDLPNTGGAATTGRATLVAGTVTVNTTAATSTANIFCQRMTAGGTLGFATTITRSNNVSFTITADNALDTSTYMWWIVEVH